MKEIFVLQILALAEVAVVAAPHLFSRWGVLQKPVAVHDTRVALRRARRDYELDVEGLVHRHVEGRQFDAVARHMEVDEGYKRRQKKY